MAEEYTTHVANMTVYYDDDDKEPELSKDMAVPKSLFDKLVDLHFEKECTSSSLTCRLCARIKVDSDPFSREFPTINVSCMIKQVVFKITTKFQQHSYYYYGISQGPLRYTLRALCNQLESDEKEENPSKFFKFYTEWKFDFRCTYVTLVTYNKDLNELNADYDRLLKDVAGKPYVLNEKPLKSMPSWRRDYLKWMERKKYTIENTESDNKKSSTNLDESKKKKLKKMKKPTLLKEYSEEELLIEDLVDTENDIDINDTKIDPNPLAKSTHSLEMSQLNESSRSLSLPPALPLEPESIQLKFSSFLLSFPQPETISPTLYDSIPIDLLGSPTTETSNQQQDVLPNLKPLIKSPPPLQPAATHKTRLSLRFTPSTQLPYAAKDCKAMRKPLISPSPSLKSSMAAGSLQKSSHLLSRRYSSRPKSAGILRQQLSSFTAIPPSQGSSYVHHEMYHLKSPFNQLTKVQTPSLDSPLVHKRCNACSTSLPPLPKLN